MRGLHLPHLASASALVSALALGSPASTVTSAQQSDPWSRCRPDGPLLAIKGLPEASGLAVSQRVPGRLWTHNDSGPPILVAIDAKGAVTAQVRVAGAKVEDWEAIAIGPCGGGSCLYVGDIGDNNAIRRAVTIYRLPEPLGSGPGATAEVFHATYPDGPQDAEALLVTPGGDLFIVTKGETRPVALYRFPAGMKPGASVTLERVGQSRGGKGAEADRITDGAVSPDGAWVVLRSKTALMFYAAKELLSGTWREAARVDLRPLQEPQGEGVAFGAANTVYLVGEAAGAGSFGRVACGAR
jgi:hypothetical protein